MKFGRTVRRLREKRRISIAQLARKVGMSPTYLAPIEREVFPPPAENKVVKIAKALDQDSDEFLAIAGRVASDLHRIIRKRPNATARLLRAVSELPEAEVERIVKAAEARRRSLAKKTR